MKSAHLSHEKKKGEGEQSSSSGNSTVFTVGSTTLNGKRKCFDKNQLNCLSIGSVKCLCILC